MGRKIHSIVAKELSVSDRLRGQTLSTIPYKELEIEELGTIRFASGNYRTDKRTYSLLTKEPTTITWIDSFAPSAVFVDIGANVGVYSVYAALFRGARVFSFEPQALNYAELYKNIFLNQLFDSVTGYCVALSDENALSKLYLSRFGVAEAHNDFSDNRFVTQADESTAALEPLFGDMRSRLAQGSVGMTLDSLVQSGAIPAPDHIKIDVDGFEWNVVQGARQTLADPRLSSVLIELDERVARHDDVKDFMNASGWHFSQRQVDRSLPLADYEDNYIYFRDPAFARIFEG